MSDDYLTERAATSSSLEEVMREAVCESVWSEVRCLLPDFIRTIVPGAALVAAREDAGVFGCSMARDAVRSVVLEAASGARSDNVREAVCNAVKSLLRENARNLKQEDALDAVKHALCKAVSDASLEYVQNSAPIAVMVALRAPLWGIVQSTLQEALWNLVRDDVQDELLGVFARRG